MSDGRQTALLDTAEHWDIARGLLAYVRSIDSERPAPGKDAMVRQWYRATAAWMQDREDHETRHLVRARELFPADPDILFLSGCQHEVYASPDVQGVLRSAVLPTGWSLDIGPRGHELRKAETFFRRSLDANPAQPETRLRLGRVLAALERHEDAARELREAVSSTTDRLLLYYGHLFLGAAEEALGHYDIAAASYEQAASLYPAAQSPHLALSELARRRGDRGIALAEMQKVFDLPSDRNRDDPWWTYHVAQARNIGELLTDLRRPFLTEARP